MLPKKKKDAFSGDPAAARLRKKSDRAVVATVLSLLAAVIVVSITFSVLIDNYRRSTGEESAAHLTEINRELQLYVETKIGEYWNAAHSMAGSLSAANIGDDAMLGYLAQQRDIYDMSEITLFTRSGYAVNTRGGVLSNDVASETVADVLLNGESLTIKDSTVVYTVVVDTDELYHGSEIVAVSVEQDLGSFLDSMGISAFNGTGLVYLTKNNGALISKLTHSDADRVYNLFALLEESVIEPLSDNADSLRDLLTSEDCVVFLRETDSGRQYVVASPIRTGYEEMRLFYFVPESVVDQTTDSFSQYIVTFSIIVILGVVAGAVAVLVHLYKARRRLFDADVSIREQMLELLVQNSRSAFSLFEIGKSEPRFHSGNCERIFGEPYHNLEKTGAGYRLRDRFGTESDALREVNSQLADWDGRSEFRSTFIRNPSAAIPAYFEIQLYPVKNSGEKEVFVGIAQDVTPLYERQAVAAEALAMAEQANQAKTHFLSNMSHDIRTPMNAIVNMTDFAIESIGEPEKQREYLNTLRESSAHLLQIINDVLDMSRIESGHLTIAADPFELRGELERIADIVRPLCAESGQTFTVDFGALKSSAVLGDQVKLSQILMNLLSNANKFTPKGGTIRFTAEELPALHENTANVRFRVEDTGIGISGENLKKIFEPFARVDTARVSRTEGTGLGLSICHSYINAMGGTIACESEEGRGSTFTVELFFTIAQPVSAASAASADISGVSFAGRRCLLCEDNQVNRAIAAKLLGHLGFAIDTAADGCEGAEKFAASAPGYYDVIYMDVKMPVMDGYEATAAIRSSAHPQAKTVPIIAMTANVFAEDVERARAAGMNGHLGKPIIVNELIEKTDMILNNGGEQK